jgi:NAD(P)-dependent dehydrogenase (short-subunit alcohol dehydrogenase family)
MSQFTSQVVLITGAAGNLGRAVAQAFAEQGARLALLDRDQMALQEMRDALPKDTEAATWLVDLLDADSVKDVVQAVFTHFGQIDVLANIAGGFTMGPPVQDVADRDWELMMNLNARSAFYVCRAVLPGMVQQGGGRVINVSARAALAGRARMAPYCASKAAVLTLTESLAEENKPQNINVNCILPGTIDTPQNRADMPDADFSQWVPPAALADVVLFLASTAGRCVTGAVIPVYGKG